MEEGARGEESRTASANGGAAREAAEIAHVGPIAPPEYYSTSEAGQILGIDPRQVRQLLKAGELGGARDPKTGRWRVYQRSVHARVKDHSASSEAASASLSEPTPTTDLERQVAVISARLKRVEERAQADVELERRRADLERRWAALERTRAERLERKLRAEGSKGFFRELRTVGGNILGTAINNDVNVAGPLPKQEAPTSRQEVPHQDSQVAKKKLPLPLDFLLQLLVCAALVFGVVKPFVMESFHIPSESMVPTLKVGDRVLVNKFVYRFEAPNRGDIVILNAVEGNKQEMLIKRVIGLPGNKIELRHGKLYLNGQRQNEPYVVNKACVRGMPKTCSYGPVTVPEGRYFVMGDNRAKSEDSRYFGPVSGDNIKGEAFLRWWPPDRAGLPY